MIEVKKSSDKCRRRWICWTEEEGVTVVLSTKIEHCDNIRHSSVKIKMGVSKDAFTFAFGTSRCGDRKTGREHLSVSV